MNTNRAKCICLISMVSLGLSHYTISGDTNAFTAPVSNTNSSSSFPLMFTTEAYRKEALRLVIQEANRVALELHLQEALPIVETNLVEQFIEPYGARRILKAIGSVTTSNYIYYVSVDQKLSYVESTHQDRDRLKWAAEYSWPIVREDTNAAYQLATQWLTAASMDVKALDADCSLRISSIKLKGQDTNAYFLPVYWVYWTKGSVGHGSVASVELFMPKKTLLQLRVEDSKYILRKPLLFTNLNLLLTKPQQP